MVTRSPFGGRSLERRAESFSRQGRRSVPVVSEPASEVVERAQRALKSSPIFALRELRVECEGEVLWIHGRVSSFYHKQLAQEAIRSLSSGWQVVNSIDVD